MNHYHFQAQLIDNQKNELELNNYLLTISNTQTQKKI